MKPTKPAAEPRDRGKDDKIRRFADIPDVLTMEVPPADYIVPALSIARNTITLWTGSDGDGKTFMAQAMACAVASGGKFLGMQCQQAPVLYVDLENPAYMVQDRLRSLVGEGPLPNLRVWGMWNAQRPPQFGSDVLISMVKEVKPLLIVDNLRYFHNCEENDSTEMAKVMQYLRRCASDGAAVVLLHHPAKQEGSTGRGSSAIRGACDLALLHSLNKETQIITLKIDKNRHGKSRSISVSADFEAGRFEVADCPWIVARNKELDRLQQIIATAPGQSQNAIIKEYGGMRSRVAKLLAEGNGTRWEERHGPGRSKLYYPTSRLFAGDRTTARTTEQPEGTGGGLFSVSPLQGGEQPNHHAETPVPAPEVLAPETVMIGSGSTLPSCPKCGSYALYKGEDGTNMCQTCSQDAG